MSRERQAGGLTLRISGTTRSVSNERTQINEALLGRLCPPSNQQMGVGNGPPMPGGRTPPRGGGRRYRAFGASGRGPERRYRAFGASGRCPERGYRAFGASGRCPEGRYRAFGASGRCPEGRYRAFGASGRYPEPRYRAFGASGRCPSLLSVWGRASRGIALRPSKARPQRELKTPIWLFRSRELLFAVRRLIWPSILSFSTTLTAVMLTQPNCVWVRW